MVDASYNALKRAGKECNSCFLALDGNESQKRLGFQKSVKKQLCDVISSGDGWKNVAREAFDMCNGCDYKENRVYQLLEVQGVRF